MPSPDPGDLRYHQLQRLGRAGWLPSGLGVLSLLVAAMLVVPNVVAIGYAVLGQPWGRARIDPLSPAGLVVVCVTLAAAIPLAMGVTRVAHRISGRWLSSVAGHIRWSWLLACFGVAVLTLVLSVAVSLALPDQGGMVVDENAGGGGDHLTAYVLIIVLLIPLQSAGEEYAFRGYLTQAFGGVVRGRWSAAAAIVLPALLFALAHGAQDPPVFFDRFAFGVVAGALVILSGGLEAGIAMHVANNWAFFGLTLAFGDIRDALAPIAGTWWSLPGTLVQSLVYLGLVVWLGRRWGLRTAVSSAVLERPSRPV